MRGDAGDVYGSGGDVDKEQDIVRDETLDRADLDAQEVRRRQTLTVSLQKRRPSGVRVSLRSGLDRVISEDRVYFELANDQSRTVGRDEFFFSTIDTTLELQSLPQKREELAYSDNRQSDRGPEQTARVRCSCRSPLSRLRALSRRRLFAVHQGLG